MVEQEKSELCRGYNVAAAQLWKHTRQRMRKGSALHARRAVEHVEAITGTMEYSKHPAIVQLSCRTGVFEPSGLNLKENISLIQDNIFSELLSFR